ncbi:MAG: hypothetical protein A2V88_04910 [Elusimicrobia bacterium RBG_16_66_12]|nr:MAG: hypothetical protein A2V88_04910 [Elusimicrobia bacterium RBG_16_66_12]
MKLLKLIVGGFGVLSGRTIDLDKRSVVLYGRNEAGKTSFIDSLLDALYGERPKGPRNASDRAWVARYGEAPAPSRVEMVTSSGAPTASSSERPAGGTLAESSLARAVLILRAGETALAGSMDFLPAFIAKVSGGSAVSLEDAVDTLATFVGKTKAARLSKLEDILSQKIIALEGRLGSAAELEAVTKQETQTQARAQALTESVNRERAAEEALTKARDRRKVGLFEGRLAALEQTDAAIRGAGAFDKTLHQEALAHEEKRAACANQVSVARALATQTAGRVSEIERRLQASRDEQARLPSGEKRALLKMKLDERKIAEQAASAGQTDQTGVLRAAFAALGAVIVGGVVWFFTKNAGLAFIGAVIGAAAGFFLAGQFAGAKPVAAVDSRESAARLRGVIDDMGEDWRGRSPDDAEKRLGELERRSQTIGLEIEQGVRQLDGDRAGKQKHDGEVRAAESGAQDHAAKLKELLGRLGVASLDECAERLARLDHARTALTAGIKEAEAQLGQKAGTLEAAQTLLRVRIQQLRQNSGEADPSLVELGDAALDERVSACQSKKRNLESELQELGQRLQQLSQEKGILKGKIGGSLVEVHRDKIRCESLLADLQAWREAGRMAKEGLEQFSTGVEGQVRDCVAKAGPLFSAMSGGAYKGLRLKEGSDIGDDGIEVEHATHGWKPFPWMSTGACDLLWLALRVSFARQAFPDPAFLVLDEPFHTLDSERAANALKCLAQSPESLGWQFIILTKDERIAEGAVAAGLTRVDLTA